MDGMTIAAAVDVLYQGVLYPVFDGLDTPGR